MSPLLLLLLVFLLSIPYITADITLDCSSDTLAGGSRAALVSEWNIVINKNLMSSSSFNFAVSDLHPSSPPTFNLSAITPSISSSSISITMNIATQGYTFQSANLQRVATTLTTSKDVNTFNDINPTHYLYSGYILYIDESENAQNTTFYCWSRNLHDTPELVYDDVQGKCQPRKGSAITVGDGDRVYNAWPLALIRTTSNGACTWLNSPTLNEGDTFYPVLHGWDLSGANLNKGRIIFATFDAFNLRGTDLSGLTYRLYGLQPATGSIDKFTLYDATKCKLCNDGKWIACSDAQPECPSFFPTTSPTPTSTPVTSAPISDASSRKNGVDTITITTIISILAPTFIIIAIVL